MEHEAVEAPEEGGQSLAGSSGGEDERAFAASDDRPAEPLRSGGGIKNGLEPLRCDGVKTGERIESPGWGDAGTYSKRITRVAAKRKRRITEEGTAAETQQEVCERILIYRAGGLARLDRTGATAQNRYTFGEPTADTRIAQRMSIISKIGERVRDFGLLGLIQITSHKLCGLPKILVAFPPGLPHSIRLRFDTTDFEAFYEVMLHEVYSFGLPSSAKVIVDAGANIGATSVYYATRFPHARIFAIEAERSNFDALRRNVRPYPNIDAIHAALWHSEGFISVTMPPSGNYGNWGFAVSGDFGETRAITIPSLMKEFRLDNIDLLKVNIEGSEKEVFEACDWQDKVGSLVIELHDWAKPGCSEAVDRAMCNFSRSRSGELVSYRSDVG